MALSQLAWAYLKAVEAISPSRGPCFRSLGSGIEKWKVVRTLVYRMDIGRLVEWIKLSPRHLVPVSLFTGFVLFAPERWLAVFGLVDFVSQWRPYFGAVFLLSTALLLGAALVPVWGW